MKRLLFMTVLLLSAAGLVLLAGCSDDDNSTNTDLAQGDLNDPAFQAIRYGLAIPVWSADMMMNIGFMVGDSVFRHPDNPGARSIWVESALGAAADSIFLTYHDDSHYWYLYYRDIDGTTTMVVEDSVQFLHGSTPEQWPDSTQWTRVNMGGSLELVDEGNGNISAGQIVSITRSLTTPDNAVINGSQVIDAEISYAESGVSCEYALGMTGTYTNLAVNIQEEAECPSSGTYLYHGSASIECTGEQAFSYDDTWTVTMAYTGDSVRTTFENSTTRWVLTESCGNQGQTPIRPTLRKK
jgi:hypothetical protein